MSIHSPTGYGSFLPSGGLQSGDQQLSPRQLRTTPPRGLDAVPEPSACSPASAVLDTKAYSNRQHRSEWLRMGCIAAAALLLLVIVWLSASSGSSSGEKSALPQPANEQGRGTHANTVVQYRTCLAMGRQRSAAYP